MLAIEVGRLHLLIFASILILTISATSVAFADPGQVDQRSGNNPSTNDKIATRSLELVEPQPIGVTFFGHGGYSADAIGTSSHQGIVSAEVPAGSTVEQAYVYVTKYNSCTASDNITFDGQVKTVDRIGVASWGGCAYKKDVTSQVSSKIGSGNGITDFTTDYSSSPNADGVVLVVIYSNPALPEVSVAIMDGAQNSSGDNFLLGLAQPLNKNVQGFAATMSLGIGFSYQGSAGHVCGSGQFSTIDINSQRLTSCAGNFDDGVGQNGALITVGGVGDDTNNPPNPNGSGGEDDELYDISGFLNNGDTQIQVHTSNPSNDDIIFLAIIQLTAKASVGEICGDGIDNDKDGLVDEGCQVEQPTRVCNSYNFDGEVVPEEFSGVTHTESVAGYTAEGFSGNYLRNLSANPPQKTTLTLTNLPEHNFIDLGFLLAIIDSWDGETEGTYSPDIMNVDVDGNSIFSTGFVGAGGVQTYVPSDGVLLLGINEHQNRAGNPGWDDSAYNMTNESIFRGIPHTSDSLTIDWYASGSGWQGGNDESWAIDDVEVCTDTFVAPPPPETQHRGSDNQWDTRPTFGISNEDRETQLVDSGFSFNGQYFTITDNHHTPFEEQSVDIGTTNTFSAKVYADKGLKVQEFLFGIPVVGEAQLAELGVEVWYDINGNINDVKVVQKSEVIDPETVSVTHEKSKCLSTDPEPVCDTTSVSMTFMEPLKDKVMAIKAIDWKNRDQRTYLNKGFDISGESLNPMLTKMIPSNQKNQGLIQVTQLAKYSPYWQSSDGRMFEMNSFGSFKEINQTFERFQDNGDARTRLHSGFVGLVENEKERATNVFDATKFISELPDSFGYHIEITDRMSDEMKNNMHLQEEIAKGILDQMDNQHRYY